MSLTTKNGMNAFECVSAMQKCIRRGLEREAMEFAVELGHSSKSLASMVCTRLQIISHEDIGLADPFVQVYVATACQQAMAWYDPDKPGKWRMPVGNAIRLMARADKSREGDHFNVAVGLQEMLHGYAPKIPDCAKDMHTIEGRRMGRGIDHFLTEGVKLVPEPESRDKYQDEAEELWREKAAGGQKPSAKRADPPPAPRRGSKSLWEDNE